MRPVLVLVCRSAGTPLTLARAPRAGTAGGRATRPVLVRRPGVGGGA